MSHQVLAPCMQHGHETDLGPEVFWILGDCAQRLCRGVKEDVVADAFVL